MSAEGNVLGIFSPELTLSQFFDRIFGEQTGYVYVPTKNPVTSAWVKKFFEWPEQKDQLISYVVSNSADLEVYYSPALFKEPREGEESITKADFKGTYFAWAEFDGDLPSQESMQGIPAPSLRIKSSTAGHEHWYWRLDFFETDPDVLEKLTRRLAYALGADLSGWDYQQVLRPPATIHHESRKTTQLLETNNNRVNIERFADLPDIPDHTWNIDIDGELPPSIEVLLKYPFKEEVNYSLFLKKTIPVGKRSSALTRAGFAMAEVGASNIEMMSVLLMLDNRWKKFVGRGEELQRKYLVGIIRYVRKELPVDLDTIDEDIPWLTLTELFNLDINVEWLIPGLVQKKGIFFITGRSGVGKTHFTFQMAAHMALGKPYLGFEFEKPTKICIIEQEISPEEFKEEMLKIMNQFSEEERQVILKNIHTVPTGYAVNLRYPRVQDNIVRRIEEFQPELVFWDSFQVSMGGDILNPESLNSSFDFLKRRLAAQYGVSNWFIHHNRKSQVGNKKPRELDDLFGGQAISAVATTVIGLWQEPGDDVIEMYGIKTRYKDLKSFKVHKMKRVDPVGFESITSRWRELGENVAQDFGANDDLDII